MSIFGCIRMCVCVHGCVRGCVHGCVRGCVHGCVQGVYVGVQAYTGTECEYVDTYVCGVLQRQNREQNKKE